MGRYAVTGARSGIGCAIATALSDAGHDVLRVDLADVDLDCDLSTPEGRRAAIDGIRSFAGDGLDGFIPAAGLGGHIPDATLVVRVNFFGVVVLHEAVEDLLAARRGASVLVASESAFRPGYDAEYLDALYRLDEEAACSRIASLEPGAAGFMAYGGSKTALVRWMRHRTSELAAKDVRINAIAPGYTSTALTEDARDTVLGPAIDAFAKTIPLGRKGTPEDMAHGAMFLLSEKASFVTGSTLHIDGGHDAVQRPDRVA